MNGRALVLSVFVAALTAGCGECAFRSTLRGVVHDQHGRPVAGARLRSCDPADPNRCTEAVTGADGRYALEVQMFRPGAMQCQNQGFTLQKEGCRPAEQVPVSQPPPDEVPVALLCGEP